MELMMIAMRNKNEKLAKQYNHRLGALINEQIRLEGLIIKPADYGKNNEAEEKALDFLIGGLKDAEGVVIGDSSYDRDVDNFIARNAETLKANGVEDVYMEAERETIQPIIDTFYQTDDLDGLVNSLSKAGHRAGASQKAQFIQTMKNAGIKCHAALDSNAQEKQNLADSSDFIAETVLDTKQKGKKYLVLASNFLTSAGNSHDKECVDKKLGNTRVLHTYYDTSCCHVINYDSLPTSFRRINDRLGSLIVK